MWNRSGQLIAAPGNESGVPRRPLPTAATTSTATTSRIFQRSSLNEKGFTDYLYTSGSHRRRADCNKISPESGFAATFRFVADPPGNILYYGDNLEVLRQHVPDESVDLVYLDPLFNSHETGSVNSKRQRLSRSASVAPLTRPSGRATRSWESARSCSGIAKLLSLSPPSGGSIARCKALEKSVRLSGTASDNPSGDRLS